MLCPTCKLENPPTAQRCDCGYDFITKSLEDSYARPGTDSASSRPRFSWVAGLLHGLVAYLVVVAPLALRAPARAYGAVLRSGVGFFVWALLLSYLFQTGRRIAAWSIVAILVLLVGVGAVRGILAGVQKHPAGSVAKP